MTAKIDRRSYQQLIPRMKLSIEAAVAAAVAVAFAVLSMAVIASERETVGATGYSPTTSATVSYVSLR